MAEWSGCLQLDLFQIVIVSTPIGTVTPRIGTVNLCSPVFFLGHVRIVRTDPLPPVYRWLQALGFCAYHFFKYHCFAL